MYFWRYVNFDTETEDECCGVCDDLDAARSWAVKTWERESAKGACRVDLCKINAQMDATSLADALHNMDKQIAQSAEVCETWMR